VSGFRFISLQGPTLTIAFLIANIGGTLYRMDLFFGVTRPTIKKSGRVKSDKLG